MLNPATNYVSNLRKWLNMAGCGLLIMYFVNSFYQSFPMTAYGKWLFHELNISPATATLYYSYAFVPFYFKPLYGIIADYSKKFLRSPKKLYIILCQVGISSMFFTTARYVHTIPMAFVTKIVGTIFEAFTQTLLGIIIAEMAAGDRIVSGNIQSAVFFIMNVSSLIAYTIGIPIYLNNNFDAKAIIGWTSVIPVIGMIACYFGIPSHVADKDPATTAVNEQVEEEMSTIKTLWTQFKPRLPFMIFLFLCSALPKDMDAWYQYTFEVFKDDLVCPQYTLISGMVGRIISCVIYARYGAEQENFGLVFVMSAVFSALSGLPRILLTPKYASSLFPTTAGKCAFAVAESAFGSFASQFAFLPLIVVATYSAFPEFRGMSYSVFIAVMDFGGFVSGLLSASLVKLLGISASNWDSLWLLIVISASMQIIVLAFLPLIRVNITSKKRKSTLSSKGAELPLLPSSEK